MMDELDDLLLESWHTVSAELKGKPWKMARRMERVSRKELRRPVQRCPRVRAGARGWHREVDAGLKMFCGWDWLCPGRTVVDGTATGRHVPCGRVSKKLWMPLPVWTIGDALGGRAGSAWESMPRFERRGRSFACAKCWGMRIESVQRRPAQAWNQFVSAVSGGLLYGREVDRGCVLQAGQGS